MKLAFHHFYVFTEPGASVVDRLVSEGFVEGSRNTHPGQGTSNRRIFFPNGMIEFIWIHDPLEARSPATKRTGLFERSGFRENGYSPFGVCVCSVTGELGSPPFDSWQYSPGYLPKPFELWMANVQSQTWEPSIFFLGGVKPYSEALPSKEPVSHLNGAGNIKGITFSISGKMPGDPESDGLNKLRGVELLRFEEGARAIATVKVDGKGMQKFIDLNPVCPLVIELT